MPSRKRRCWRGRARPGSPPRGHNLPRCVAVGMLRLSSMRRSRALYRDDTPELMPRASVALAGSDLSVLMPDGQCRAIALDGAVVAVADAAFRRRFVRMLTLERAGERTAIITPPDHGAIAPRAVFLPVAPEDAAV